MRLPKTLVKLAQRGEPGRQWYTAASAQINLAAPVLGVAPQRLADLLSIFSPRVSVKRSIRWTVHYIKTKQFMPDCTRSHRAALAHYEATGEIRGPKTRPFSRALMGDLDAIVLDTWMAVAFDVDQEKFQRKRVHERCSRRVRIVAKLLGWKPAEAQAAIWYSAAVDAGRNPPAMDILSELG